jgi:hypothetical protein
MIRKSRYFYFAPDNGAPSGGSAQATGADPKQGQQQSEGNDDPFAQIDLENLDDKSKAAIEAIKGKFATLQTTVQQTTQQVRQFQSAKDKVEAELNRVRSAVQDPAKATAQQDPQKVLIAQVEQTMIEAGVAPEAAKLQAPVMAKLMAAQREQIMREVGTGLTPVINTVFGQQAENAFNVARSLDQTGAFAIPEVAQQIWNSCQQIAADGTTVTPETVKNLKAMHYMAHVEKNGGNFATLQNNRTVAAPPVGMNTGGFSYPGANFVPVTPTVVDPNGARTVLDPGTKAALQNVFQLMKPGHKVQ